MLFRFGMAILRLCLNPIQTSRTGRLSSQRARMPKPELWCGAGESSICRGTNPNRILQRLSVQELLLTLVVSDDASLQDFHGIEHMKDFSNASFAPDTIKAMTAAMNGALATLPHPISSAHVQSVAETILRTAKDGERDPKVLERMALLELQISPRPSAK
jgi:hypothetical protein